MPASVAIIICTRNRAGSLRETLASVGRCTVPPDLAAELVVVDNGSTDDTAAVVRDSGLTNLPVRCVNEPTPGLSRARNAGLHATDSHVLLFTDDDVRVPPGWLAAMCRPILGGQTDAVVGGVCFSPEYEAFLSREPFRSRRGWFAATDHLNASNPTHLVGANMAFSRRIVDALGEFETELGAGARGFHEETLWAARLRAAGFRLAVAAPEASVEHHFERTRLTRATLLATAEKMARSSAWLGYHWGRDDANVPAARRWRGRVLLFLHRALTPGRRWQQPHAPAWELDRLHNLVFLETLHGFAGQPRKYHPTDPKQENEKV